MEGERDTSYNINNNLSNWPSVILMEKISISEFNIVIIYRKLNTKIVINMYKCY